MQFVTIDEFLEFLCERSHAVVFFLIDDVTGYQIHLECDTENAPYPLAQANFPVSSSLEFTQ